MGTLSREVKNCYTDHHLDEADSDLVVCQHERLFDESVQRRLLSILQSTTHALSYVVLAHDIGFLHFHVLHASFASSVW